MLTRAGRYDCFALPIYVGCEAPFERSFHYQNQVTLYIVRIRKTTQI